MHSEITSSSGSCCRSINQLRVGVFNPDVHRFYTTLVPHAMVILSFFLFAADRVAGGSREKTKWNWGAGSQEEGPGGGRNAFPLVIERLERARCKTARETGVSPREEWRRGKRKFSPRLCLSLAPVSQLLWRRKERDCVQTKLRTALIFVHSGQEEKRGWQADGSHGRWELMVDR